MWPQLFFKRFDLLENEITHRLQLDFTIKIITKHKDALPQTLQKFVEPSTVILEAGFISKQLKLILLTDRELFGTVFLAQETSHLTSKKARKLLAELEGEIAIGDYIVHEDHGIGIYQGIKQEKYEQKIPLGFGESKTKIIYEDYLLVSYAEGDELYVPLSQIDKITKYIGADSEEPEITRLSKGDWLKFRKRVKSAIEALAKELVTHFAQRELSDAPKIYVEDTDLYTRFLEAFLYQTTPDQERTEKEIYQDLTQTKPMNRLIVGDVGFGKTEVAMRAAFKAAESGYQVAVLCPTTVLAAQHEKVFTDRFVKTPFKVAAVSRFSQTENKQTLELLSEGKVDIIIGTHRLLSNDVKFKKLGLLVIDEEQKFGVKQKEKLKKLEKGVHVLMMSATPIPRSLSMALSNIQDISLIQTPPEGRKAIKTIVHKLDWQKIIEAISTEVQRGGQVYFVHNRVESIESILAKLKKSLPQIRFALAHGQMPTQRLEKTIYDFYNKESDCLVCTTIIENGIDMPNVNTIIINQAQNFGLGQLYQLRGRVGRGSLQAYAYFFYEGETVDKVELEKEVLSADDKDQRKLLKKKEQAHRYKKRLKAMLESQELGSGFNIASRDLEIRGAGNLLGKEQHGNINYVGYGLYMQLLAQEIERLKSLSSKTN